MTYAQRLADEANARLSRTDIEWAAAPAGGIYLRDRQSFTQRNTRDIADQHDRERRTWLRNYQDRLHT